MTVSRFTKFAVISVLALCSAVVSAAPRMSLGPKRQLQTLIITGNYKSPRLLAELIQSESRQPYMLLPDPARGDGRIYFVPPKSDAHEVREADFNDFIRTAGPKRIIILGDESYVPRRYEDMLDKVIPVVRVTGKNWVRVAEELTFMLNLNHLDRNYKKLHEKMFEDQPYRPVSRPAPKREEKPGEQPEQPAETAPAASDAPAAAENAPAAPAAK